MLKALKRAFKNIKRFIDKNKTLIFMHLILLQMRFISNIKNKLALKLKSNIKLTLLIQFNL